MAVDRSHDKKSPTENPTDFFRLTTKGTAYGTPGRVPDELAGGPTRELIMGNPALSTSMDPSRSTLRGRSGGSEHSGSKPPKGPER